MTPKWLLNDSANSDAGDNTRFDKYIVKLSSDGYSEPKSLH